MNTSLDICSPLHEIPWMARSCFCLTEKPIAYTFVYTYKELAVYEWDEDKSKKNLSERGLSFADAELVFAEPHLTFEDNRFDYGEPRFITFGLLKGRLAVIAHTPRGKKTRIISMRKGNYREQKIYQERLESARQDE